MITDEQRQAIKHLKLPLPLMDAETGTTYVLLEVAIEKLPKNQGFRARVPGIGAIGEGDDPTEATVALKYVLRGALGLPDEKSP